MITIQLDAVHVECLEGQDANHNRVPILVHTCPQTGIRVVIPYPGDSARVVAAHLDGRPAIQIAGALKV